MRALYRSVMALGQYPSAVAGLGIVLVMVLFALFAVISIPYQEAVRLWRGGGAIWGDTPRNVPPAWSNWFTSVDQPTTIRLD